MVDTRNSTLFGELLLTVRLLNSSSYDHNEVSFALRIWYNDFQAFGYRLEGARSAGRSAQKGDT